MTRTITIEDIELARSDLGDGGWSLHLGDDPRVLASGESDWDERVGWLRPDGADYQAALAAARAATPTE